MEVVLAGFQALWFWTIFYFCYGVNYFSNCRLAKCWVNDIVHQIVMAWYWLLYVHTGWNEFFWLSLWSLTLNAFWQWKETEESHTSIFKNREPGFYQRWETGDFCFELFCTSRSKEFSTRILNDENVIFHKFTHRFQSNNCGKMYAGFIVLSIHLNLFFFRKSSL